jgi:hypothetical protein
VVVIPGVDGAGVAGGFSAGAGATVAAGALVSEVAAELSLPSEARTPAADRMKAAQTIVIERRVVFIISSMTPGTTHPRRFYYFSEKNLPSYPAFWV